MEKRILSNNIENKNQFIFEFFSFFCKIKKKSFYSIDFYFHLKNNIKKKYGSSNWYFIL
jgi:hypothetical protein